MPLEIVIVPCLADNYAYLAHDEATEATAVIDVPDAAKVLNALRQRGWRASHVLITHHHNDHIAGVEALAAATGARVYGARADAHRLPALEDGLGEGDMVRIGMDEAHVIEVPGHTIGHIAYHFPRTGVVFTADSLMSCGCGRLFEGSPTQMWQSLSKLGALPPQTRVYSGHEYTEANIRFALSVDPDNAALIERAARVAALRAEGQPTVPATLAEELATNPYYQSARADMKAHLGLAGSTDTDTFAELRARKDRF